MHERRRHRRRVELEVRDRGSSVEGMRYEGVAGLPYLLPMALLSEAVRLFDEVRPIAGQIPAGLFQKLVYACNHRSNACSPLLL